jgi:hypothetical protein
MFRSWLYKVAIRCLDLIPIGLVRNFLKLLYHRPKVADRAGYSVFPLVFYSPFPVPSEVDVSRLKFRRALPGIDFPVPKSLELLGKLTRYSPEVAEFLEARTGDLTHWAETFPLSDSGTLYAMLRHLKPKRYIEVGCGYSTRCSTAALARNQQEGCGCQSAFIEPYPPPYLTETTLPGEFIKKKVQDVPLERFQKLQAGDVLFIDTSHVIKVQNDVEWELLYILPLLESGVIVHIHDIFTPYDYPTEWLVVRGGGNEQYALECLLSGGDNWEVILPVHLLWREHPQLLRQVVDSDDRPGSFWFMKVKQTKPAAGGEP